MAYIKIFPIKVTDKKALDYITNPDKTDEKLLVSSFGCSPETADLEFAMTRESAKKNGMDKGNNLACIILNIAIRTINRFSPSAFTPTMTSSDSLSKPFSTIPFDM